MAWIRACGGGSPAIPDGKTVTPINDVTIWQQCAGISNPTYTTLSEILADVGVLSTLMASDNAVDYLVRSKVFIGKIPTMTSNTTPYGEAIGYRVGGFSYPPYYAFDGNNSTFFNTNNSSPSNDEYVGYDFVIPIAVTTVKITPRFSANNSWVKNFTVKGSNDKITWDALFSGTHGNNGNEETFQVNSAQSYRYVGVFRNGASYSDTTMQIVNLQIDTTTGITVNQYAMQYIGQNNYASNTLLADSDWRDAICNSTYFESVLNVKVPTMTSNTTPSGVASASSSSSYWQPWYAFTNDGEWISASGTSNQHITYDFGVNRDIKMCMAKFTTASSIGGGYPVTASNITLKSSQDNNTFTDISTVIDTSAIPSGQTTDIVFSSIARGRAFRCLVNGHNTSYDGNTCVINILQFYGREDV